MSHGWIYDLSGRLLRATEMEGAMGFDPAAMQALLTIELLCRRCVGQQRAPGV
jgi:hypothetical protein